MSWQPGDRWLSRAIGVLVAALAALSTAAASPPAPEGWREQVGVTGIGGTYAYSVRTMLLFDEDAAGPRPSYLIAGGSFTVAGDVAASNIAAWDGRSWRALGSGFNDEVYALTTFEGSLIAGGSFTASGAVGTARVSRWTGSGWQPMGAGLNGTVRALAVFNGSLYAGGDFNASGATTAWRIARWTGSAWEGVGTGVGSAGDSSTVHALAVHNNELIVGGQFSSAGGIGVANLARWTGAAWASQSATGLPGAVHCLAVYGGTLHAGGAFNGVVSGLPVRFVARFISGLWRPVGAGIVPGGSDDGLAYSGVVNAMLVRNGQLVVVGDFKWVEDFGGNVLDVRRVAAWDGADWYPAGATIPGVDSEAESVCDYGGQLMVGGRFERAGGLWVRGIAGTNGVTWSSLTNGISNRVLSLTTYAGRLIAGGPFASIGGINTNSIASWDGTNWQPLGTGITGLVPQVYSLASYSGTLVAGGFFEFAGGTPVRNVARWNGTSWSAMGQGLDGIVRALVVWFDPVRQQSSLYAGGDFRFSGSTAVNRIARWDEATQSWQPVGGGILDDAVNLDWNGVFSLQGYLGRLYVGGYFNGGGTVTSRFLVTWDGAQWAPPPAGVVNDQVRAMAIFDGQLVITGYFRMLIGGQWYNYIASWDGVSPTWARLGEGLNDGATELALFNGQLVVGGGFTAAGGVAGINRIARWNGSTFSPMGTGLDTLPNALASYDPDGLGPRPPVLAVGGEFGTAGGRVSPFFAMWGPISDSIWNATTGGDGALSQNWLYSASPDPSQSIYFDSSLSTVPLIPQYRVTLSSALTAKRMTVNTNQVTLDLSGRAFSLLGPPSDFSPPLTIGKRAGAGTDTRLVLANTGAAATFQSAGVVVGGVADPALFTQFTARDPALTAVLGGNVAVAALARGTMEVSDGATVRYGADSTSYFGVGLHSAGNLLSNANVNVLTGGKLEAATPLRVLSLGSALGSRAGVSINGAGSRWTALQSDFFVGDQGSVTLSIASGGELISTTTNSVIVGRGAGSVSSVSIGAGSRWWETTRDINIGGGGGASEAKVRISAGGVLQAPAVNLLPGGGLGGQGVVQGDVYNFGEINPGTEAPPAPPTPGTLTINGAYRQFGLIGGQTGLITLNATGAGSDLVVVNGAAELAGGLRVVFDPSFVPGANLSLELVRATTFVGGVQRPFDIAVLPALSDGRYVRVVYPTSRGPGAVRLIAEQLGDALELGSPDTATVAGRPTGAVVADFDGDNAEDLAITVPSVTSPTGAPGSVVILFSAGSDPQGNWSGFRTGPGGSIEVAVQNEPVGVDSGDFNNDGREDLAIVNASSNSVTVLRNTGDPAAPFNAGAGSRLDVTGVGQRPVAIAVANMNPDPVELQTAPEFVVASSGIPEVRVFTPNATATAFTTPPGGLVPLPAGSEPTSITTFDPDQDKNVRRRHAAVTLNGSNSLGVIESDGPTGGGIILSSPALIPVPTGPTRVIAADLRPEEGSTRDPAGLVRNRDLIVISGGTRVGGSIPVPNTRMSVLIDNTARGSTNLSFRPPVSVDLGAPVLLIAALDQDLDSDADLAVLTRNPDNSTVVQLLRNDYLVAGGPSGVVINAQPILVPQPGSPQGGLLASIVVAGGLSGRVSKPDDLVTVADPGPARGPGGMDNVRGIPNLGGACSLADITVIGGSAGELVVPDGQLTVDDIIVFVNVFSAPDAPCPGPAPCSQADIVGIGGVEFPADGLHTVDDLIAFVNAYGDGCR